MLPAFFSELEGGHRDEREVLAVLTGPPLAAAMPHIPPAALFQHSFGEIVDARDVHHGMHHGDVLCADRSSLLLQITSFPFRCFR